MNVLDRALTGIARVLPKKDSDPVQLVRARPVSGGCINEAQVVETSAGRFFIKSNALPVTGLFSAEAAGLTALAASNGSLVIPEVIAFEDPTPDAPGWIALEYLEPGPRPADFDEALGRGLAELHAQSAESFGFAQDTFCGTTRQPNRTRESWVDFYREQRLEHQLRVGSEAGRYRPEDRAVFGRLFDRLDNLLEDCEPPALLHGDLWSGNLHASPTGQPALIDPATYFGHREAEMGMMTLFGGFSGTVYAAYEEVRPLAPGWRKRNALYTLYHVMNHATLFGGGYASQAVGIARRFG